MVEKRLSHSGRLFKIAEGDLLLSLAQLDQIARQGHQHACLCSCSNNVAEAVNGCQEALFSGCEGAVPEIGLRIAEMPMPGRPRAARHGRALKQHLD